MMQSIDNPYGHRGPIEDPGDFYGRTDVLSQLFECIRTRRCIALIGERRSGKTSILFQITRRDVQSKYLVNPDDCLFAYINGEKVESPPVFFQQLFKLIATQVPSFTIRWSDQLPISEVSILLQQLRPRRLVILFDEFDHVVAQKVFPPGTFYQLRAIAQELKSVSCDVSFIIATKRDLADDLVHEIGTDDLARAVTYYLNIFNKCFIGSFTKAEFQSFLDETSRRTGVPVSQYKQQIEDLAGRFPFFVQIACYHYFDELINNGQSPDHALIRHKFMDEARSHFGYIWSHLDDHERASVIALAAKERIPEDTLWPLTRKGYAIDGNLFSSAFAEFVLQIEKGGPVPEQGVYVDERSGDVWAEGKLVDPPLAELEYKLLAYLYNRCNQICTRDDIAIAVWGEQAIEGVTDAQIDQLVRRVRLGIEPDPANPRYIETLRGRGHRLKGRS